MSRIRIFAVIAAGLLVAGFAAANVHLVSVAIDSQTDCVIDVQQEGAANRAAKPSC